MFTQLIDWLDDNHWWVVAFVVIAALIIWAYGCESTVPSLLYPNQRVNADGLNAEIQYFNARAAGEVNEIAYQNNIKQAFFNGLNAVALAGGTISTGGLLTLITTIASVAFGLQQRKAASNNSTGTGTTTTPTPTS
jgi:hypothetical protein